jgi:hypothetical protein
MENMPTEQFLKQLRVDRRYHALRAHLEALIQAFDVEELDELTRLDTRYSPSLLQRYKTIRCTLEAALVILQENTEHADHFDWIEDVPKNLSHALSAYGLAVRKQRAKPEAA